MSVFQCLSCQHTSFPVTREMVRLKPCALGASEVRYVCQCCINHQRRWAKGQIQSHWDQWTFVFPIESQEFWIRSRWMSELCQPRWETVVQMLACCLASHNCKVKQGILVSKSGISQQDPALLVSLHGGKAGPNLPAVATCEDILFLQKLCAVHGGTSASCISYHLVLPGNSSYLFLFHSTASNKWQDLALSALQVWKPQKKMWLSSCP